ncbi:MAG: DUF2892 domain-containing protein [Chloroflexi bacterium]|nr:DUF2892 domain-containing protein [Chloroflexota bacterium]
MPKNESTVDRVVRIVLGLILLYAWLGHMVGGTLGVILGLIGLVLLVTGAIGFCPLYTVLGFQTKK